MNGFINIYGTAPGSKISNSHCGFPEETYNRLWEESCTLELALIIRLRSEYQDFASFLFFSTQDLNADLRSS